LAGVLELEMIPARANVQPTVSLQHPDHLSAAQRHHGTSTIRIYTHYWIGSQEAETRPADSPVPALEVSGRQK
jgi:hypothetical protein